MKTIRRLLCWRHNWKYKANSACGGFRCDWKLVLENSMVCVFRAKRISSNISAGCWVFFFCAGVENRTEEIRFWQKFIIFFFFPSPQFLVYAEENKHVPWRRGEDTTTTTTFSIIKLTNDYIIFRRYDNYYYHRRRPYLYNTCTFPFPSVIFYFQSAISFSFIFKRGFPIRAYERRSSSGNTSPFHLTTVAHLGFFPEGGGYIIYRKIFYRPEK